MLEQKKFAAREDTIKKILMKVDEANSQEAIINSVSLAVKEVELAKAPISEKSQENPAKSVQYEQDFLHTLFRPHPRSHDLKNEGNRHSLKN